MFRSADSVNAGRTALGVFLSRYLCANPLPERVATTDLFPVVADLAAKGVGRHFTCWTAGSEEVQPHRSGRDFAWPLSRVENRPGDRNGYFSRE